MIFDNSDGKTKDYAVQSNNNKNDNDLSPSNDDKCDIHSCNNQENKSNIDENGQNNEETTNKNVETQNHQEDIDKNSFVSLKQQDIKKREKEEEEENDDDKLKNNKLKHKPQTVIVDPSKIKEAVEQMKNNKELVTMNEESSVKELDAKYFGASNSIYKDQQEIRPIIKKEDVKNKRKNQKLSKAELLLRKKEEKLYRNWLSIYLDPYIRETDRVSVLPKENTIKKFKLIVNHKEVKPLLSIATSMLYTNSSRKNVIQMNTIKNIGMLSPYLTLTIYDKIGDYSNITNQYNNIFVSTNFNENQFHTPFLGSILYDLEHSIEADYYGYINGDILLPPTVIDLFHEITKMRERKLIKNKLLVVGRRLNVNIYEKDTSLYTPETQSQFFERYFTTKEQFISVAQDYFLYTKSTFDLSHLPPVVIGRNGYDNYLVSYCYAQPSIDLIDASNALAVLHQTDSHGNWAGGRDNGDKGWNLMLTEQNITVATTSMANYKAYIYLDGHLSLVPSKGYDDDYSKEEYEFIDNHIPKDAKRCLYYSNGRIQGLLLRTACHKIDVIIWDIHHHNAQQKLSRSRILFHKRNIKEHNNHKAKNECANFRGYINLPRYRMLTYDVVIIDGICPFQAAQAISYL
ncbi:hypothetical protein WA158_006173 [Blastocystis sp. Blastoise]